MSVGTRLDAAVESVAAAAYTIPTEEPEADGTLDWDSTTIVVVEAAAGGERGLGYTYCDGAAGGLVESRLRPLVEGRDPLDVPGAWEAMARAVRNVGRPGIASCAIAAVDCALWDLKARLLGVPLCSLLGRVRETVPLYGSGGFTSYTDAQLEEQLGAWAAEGFASVKMKVGREPDRDVTRVRIARAAIGDLDLFVDANGAYERKQALGLAGAFDEQGVTYFEEPVSSDDLEGLRLLRDRAPQAIAAGEYAYVLADFGRLVEVVDVLQADVTRCGGIGEFLRAAALAKTHGVEFSAHTAPALHAHVCCAVQPFAHLEWFHDHARIESMLFDGALEPEHGELRPDLSRPGNGLELKRQDAERWRAT